MGDLKIPGLDNLNKNLREYVVSKEGNWNINYFKPSIEHIGSHDTHLCFAAPEYAMKNISEHFTGQSRENIIEGYSDLGCWKDTGNRALPKQFQDVDGNSDREVIQKCNNIALQNGYPIFAVQYGHQCFATNDSNSYKRYGQAWNCSSGRGGSWAQNVYKAEPEVLTPPPNMGGNFEYLGCWADDGARTMNQYLGDMYDDNQKTNIQKCNEAAYQRGLPVFAVQYGHQCFASSDPNSFKRIGNAYNCNGGRGGSWAQDVFKTQEPCDKTPPNNYPNKGPALAISSDTGYTFNASSILSNDRNMFGPQLAFDGNTNDHSNSKWSFWHTEGYYNNNDGTYTGSNNIANFKGEWMTVTMPYPETIVYYDLYQRSDCCRGQRNPNSWVVLGSNDGNKWDKIDSQVKQYFEPKGQQTPNSYKVANPGNYKMYAIVVSVVGNCGTKGDRYCLQIEEWKLYPIQVPPPVFDIPLAPYTPPINMIKFDNNLYSPEQAKFNLAVKFNTLPINDFFNIKTMEKNAKIKQGLKLKLVKDTYFWDDVSFFDNIPYVDGFYNNFNNIQQSISPNTPNNWGTPFSCEWVGYVKFPKNGTYKFSMGGDDACYLWLGNTALYDYNANNAFISIGGLHGVVFRSNTTKQMSSEEYYPIRIQYGQNYGGTDFILRITDSNNHPVTNCFYSILNSDGSLHFPSTIYYSLVAQSDRDSDPKLFYCYYYIANKDGSDVVANKKSANYAYENVWTYPPANGGGNLNKGTSALFDTDGNLYFIDSAGNRTNISNIKTSGYGFNLNLTNNGDLIITQNGSQLWSLVGDQNNNNNYNQNILNNGIINPDWQKQITVNHITSSIQTGQLISASSIRYLISPNGKFKLEISPSVGNFVLKTTINAFQTNSDKIKYTYESDDAHYLYSINFDMKFGQYFYTNNSTKTLEYIPPENNILGYKNNYTSYPNSFPDPVLQAKKVNSSIDCQTACNNDKKCNFYYYYEDDQTNKYCALNNDPNNTPKLISNNDKKIVNPSLNVRLEDLDLDPQYVAYGDTIPVVPQSNYDLFNSHTLLKEQLSKPRPLGIKSDLQYRKLICQLKQKGEDANTYLTDECKQFFVKEHFQNQNLSDNIIKEGMNGFNPVPAECYDTTGINKITCSQSIIKNQIQPLVKTAKEYENKMDKVRGNYDELKNGIKDYKNTFEKMDKIDEYDFSGKTLKYPDYSPYSNYKKTIMDGVDEDISVMVQQENNIYLLGTITAATLLITAIFIGSR